MPGKLQFCIIFFFQQVLNFQSLQILTLFLLFKAEEIHNVKIFHYGAGLHFANRDYFREVLFNLTGLDPVRWHEQAMKRVKKQRQAMDKAIKHAAAAAAIKEFHDRKKATGGFGGGSNKWVCCLKKGDDELEDTKVGSPSFAPKEVGTAGKKSSTADLSSVMDLKVSTFAMVILLIPTD